MTFRLTGGGLGDLRPRPLASDALELERDESLYCLGFLDFFLGRDRELDWVDLDERDELEAERLRSLRYLLLR